MKKIIDKLSVYLLLFFAFIVAGFGFLRMETKIPIAESEIYIPIYATDVTFRSFSTSRTGEYYILSVEYENDDLVAGVYKDKNFTLPINDGANTIEVNQFYIGNDHSLQIRFVAEEFDSLAPNEIVFPKGLKLNAPSDRANDGVYFRDGLTLTNLGNDIWSVAAENSYIVPYEVRISEKNTTAVWNEPENALVVCVGVPFTSDVTALYEHDLSCSVNGEVYEAKPIVRHVAYESLVEFVFPDADVLQNSENIVSVTCGAGFCQSDEALADITFIGSVTFYNYIDGTWDIEKAVCVQERVNGELSKTKVYADEEYTFRQPFPVADKVFCGWGMDGNFYEVGESISLSDSTKLTVDIDAVYVTYGLYEGASVRCDEDLRSSGIRFASKILQSDTQAYADYIAGYGVIVMPTNMIGVKDFTLENYNGENQAQDFYVAREELVFEKSDTITFYATIASVLEKNYNRSFSARAYIRTTTGTTVWCANIESRSVYEVATLGLQKDGNTDSLSNIQKRVMESYANGVIDLAFDGVEATLRCAANNKAITGIESFSEVDGIVTVVFITAKQSIPCVTYNGERILRFEQASDGERLRVTFSKI